MKKTKYILAVTLVMFLTACTTRTYNTESGKIRITTSFYPIYEFTQQVGKNKVQVTNITPAGTEPHDFEPTPKDRAKIENAQIFIYNGAGFETWAEKIIPDLQNNHVEIVNNSQGIPLLDTQKVINPHFWLDPVLAQTQIDTITNALVKVDPQNTAQYFENAQNYKQELNELDREIKQNLSQCNRNTIIVSHDAFAYFAKRYNIQQVAIAGLSPDEEPSPQKLAQVADLTRKNNIKYIFFESLTSPKLSDTIAKEVGAQTIVLNPIEGLTQEEINQGKTYISIQRDNLNNLKIALECS